MRTRALDRIRDAGLPSRPLGEVASWSCRCEVLAAILA
jgi:hypothetical protein